MPGDLEKASLGATPKVHRAGNILMCGQPTEKDFLLAKKRGIQHVVTLRSDGELNWDEEAVVAKAGMKFSEIPFRGPNEMTDELIDRVRGVLREAKGNGESIMLHCAGAVRVGAVWLAFRVLDEGQDLDQAIQEARAVGMRGGFESRAVEYIRAQQAK